MIDKSIISRIYETASIKRWNDHIRPATGFTELDKQAHKMVYAYILAKCQNDSGAEKVDMQKIIEGGIAEFFHRAILTDIKPPIYHKLMREKGIDINNWVISQLEPSMKEIGGGFFDRLKLYFNDENYASLERKILKAAHYFASDWEFKIIYPMNQTTYEIEKVKWGIYDNLKSCNTFEGYEIFTRDAYLQDFMRLVAKLRYQQRWSKAVRMPETNVMGHMLVVAILSYFMTLELDKPCKNRLVNNFFSGLFHDIPEALTRDIVSPIKKSVEGLGDILAEIETEQMQKIVFPMLPKEWHNEMTYYTKDEFDSKVVLYDVVKKVSSDEINESFNDDRYNPIDGQIIRGCDHLSAYVEAYLSLSYGIGSEHITTGYDNLYNDYKEKVIGGIDFSVPFGYFILNK